MARVTETVYIVASPDGSVAEFTVFGDAEAAQQSTAGSQLRTTTRHRDVPADYAVMVGDEIVQRFKTAAEAGQLARGTPGSVVVIIPAE